MKILFDGIIYPETTPLLTFSDRGLLYGDGIFETMLMTDGHIRNLSGHVNRISEGMKVLQIQGKIAEDVIREKAISLAKEHALTGMVRVKWVIWRKPGGLYTPASEDFHELIKVTPFSPGTAEVQKADFAEKAIVSYSAISRFKTVSALPYVLASIECRDRSMDDLIILSADGNVAECLYSNLFWGTGRLLHTPSLQTGCIEGVRRKALLKHLPELGYTIKETLSRPQELLSADYTFRTNATSIVPIRQIASHTYQSVPDDILSLTEV
ncbi:MAG: aminotransferase class IV [Cyclobacteriaceae bacterium]